jgi:hypothetical protein
LELKNKKVETSQKIWPFRTAPVGCTVFVIGRHWSLVVNCRRRWFPRRHHQASSSVVTVLNQTIIVEVIVVDIKRAAIFGSPSKSRIIQTHKRTCDAMLGTCWVPILDKNLEFLGLY